MNAQTTNKLNDYIVDCKSELLDHILQDVVVSPQIKRIRSILAEFSDILNGDGVPQIDSSQSSNILNVDRAPQIDRIQNVGRTRSRYYGEEQQNMLFFAYCMSKYDAQFVNSITGERFNQLEVFSYLAQKLSVKANTLRNHRDTFDSHVKQMRSNRVGWKIPLTEQLAEIKKQNDSLSESQLIEIGKSILNIA